MKRYLVEEAKCGVTRGGWACGPVPGNVVVTIKFKANNKSRWFSIVEFDGMPNYFLSDTDGHNILMEEEGNDAFMAFSEKNSISSLDGIDLGGDYESLFSNISEDPDNPVVPLLRYAVALVRCDMDEVEELIEMAQGRYTDELDIPVSDVEEDFVDDEDEDEEDDDEDE